MIHTDRVCHNALLQCNRILNDVQQRISQKEYKGTNKSLIAASNQVRLAIDTFVREQRTLQFKRAEETRQALADSKPKPRSILEAVHKKFQEELPQLSEES